MALGSFTLSKKDGAADYTVSGPGEIIFDPITGLTGIAALTVLLKLAFGSGGSTIKAYLQTSLDKGNSWVDIWCCSFGTANKQSVINLSGLTPRTSPITPTDGELADDTVLDGLLGDQVRVKLKIAGTYGSNTAFSGRAVAR